MMKVVKPEGRSGGEDATGPLGSRNAACANAPSPRTMTLFFPIPGKRAEGVGLGPRVKYDANPRPGICIVFAWLFSIA